MVREMKGMTSIPWLRLTRGRSLVAGQDSGRRRRPSQVRRPEPVPLWTGHQWRLPHARGSGRVRGPRRTLRIALLAIFGPVAHDARSTRIARTGDADAFRVRGHVPGNQG